MEKTIKILAAVAAVLTALGQVLVQANHYVELSKSSSEKKETTENNDTAAEKK